MSSKSAPRPEIVNGWPYKHKPDCLFCEADATSHARLAHDVMYVIQIRCCDKPECRERAKQTALHLSGQFGTFLAHASAQKNA